MVRFLLRALLVLVLLAALAVAAYTVVGDLDPATEERRVPVEVDADG